MTNKKEAVMRKLISAAILAPLVVLSGCSDSNNSFPKGQKAEGVVYDGYLNAALACVDVNLNRMCDAGEPSTKTVKPGKYTLRGLSDRLAAMPLVVTVDVNTIDMDTGTAPALDLKLTAPAGSTVVSAFSTIIQSRIESALAAGTTKSLAVLKAEATAALAAEMGLPAGFDLTTYDPIAAKTDKKETVENRRLAAKLHMANRVLSEQIAFMASGLESSAGAFAAVIANLNPANVWTAVDTDLDGMSLDDLVALNDTLAVTSEAPVVAPSAATVQFYVNRQAAVVAALLGKLPPETPTGGTGGTGGSGS